MNIDHTKNFFCVSIQPWYALVELEKELKITIIPATGAHTHTHLNATVIKRGFTSKWPFLLHCPILITLYAFVLFSCAEVHLGHQIWPKAKERPLIQKMQSQGFDWSITTGPCLGDYLTIAYFCATRSPFQRSMQPYTKSNRLALAATSVHQLNLTNISTIKILTTTLGHIFQTKNKNTFPHTTCVGQWPHPFHVR